MRHVYCTSRALRLVFGTLGGWVLFTAAAHDLYLRPPSFSVPAGASARVAMHNGDSFPGSESPPVFARVRDAQVISASGTQPLKNLREEAHAGHADYIAPTGSYVLAMRTIPNFIQLDPTQFEGYLQHESLDWVIRWRADHDEFAKDGRELYSKHVKSLVNLDRDDFALKPVGFPVEIVLLENPAKRELGETIAVQVIFRGKPAKGQPLQMAYAHKDHVETRWVGRTDADGKVQLKLESPGFWKLHTIVMERRNATPGAAAEADWESFWASVTFAVGDGR